MKGFWGSLARSTICVVGLITALICGALIACVFTMED